MSETHSIPLVLADWGQVIGLLLLVVFWVLRYLFSDQQPEEKKPQKRPQPRPVERPPGEPDAGLETPLERGQRDLRAEVDDFLSQSRQQPDAKPQRPAERPAPLVVELDPGVDSGESLSDHVQRHMRHLQESQLAEQAAHLGEEVALADDKIESRLEAKFEHRLGKLDSGKEDPVLPTADSELVGADLIAAMLTNPESVRTAVILNEILERPVDRWQ